ncbi:MAG TPA: hypothetical protein PKU78_04265 [Candidatus Dojkabacteria bacterium]|nr:hypothetical protein [Candidatus Dojkabacteria bacterium]
MAKFINLNNQLKSEIDAILIKYSLIELLASYGKVLVTGSYSYDLMAWRDYDLVIELNDYTTENVYKLVEEIGVKLNPDKLRILNNLNKTETNRPQGVWLGVYIENWKIDIWLMNSENFKKEVQNSQKLKEKLKDVDRETLISIKSELSKDPDYHVKFSSVDLYEAYLDGNVRTVQEFYEKLKNLKI